MMNLIASTYGPSTSADCLLGKFAIAYDKGHQHRPILHSPCFWEVTRKAGDFIDIRRDIRSMGLINIDQLLPLIPLGLSFTRFGGLLSASLRGLLSLITAGKLPMLVLVETHLGAKLVLQVSPDIWSQLQGLMPLSFRPFSSNLINFSTQDFPGRQSLAEAHSPV